MVTGEEGGRWVLREGEMVALPHLREAATRSRKRDFNGTSPDSLYVALAHVQNTCSADQLTYVENKLVVLANSNVLDAK
jgi:hypothetical protein